MSDFDDLLERLVLDPQFKAALAADPDRVLAGFRLSPDERSLLLSQVDGGAGTSGEVEERISKAGMAGLLSTFSQGLGLHHAGPVHQGGTVYNTAASSPHGAYASAQIHSFPPSPAGFETQVGGAHTVDHTGHADQQLDHHKQAELDKQHKLEQLEKQRRTDLDHKHKLEELEKQKQADLDKQHKLDDLESQKQAGLDKQPDPQGVAGVDSQAGAGAPSDPRATETPTSHSIHTMTGTGAQAWMPLSWPNQPIAQPSGAGATGIEHLAHAGSGLPGQGPTGVEQLGHPGPGTHSPTGVEQLTHPGDDKAGLHTLSGPQEEQTAR